MNRMFDRDPHPSRAGEVLRAVHATPGITRSEMASQLALSSGTASDAVARLVAARQLSEGASPPTGARGRPTRTLLAHPEGPLVIVAAIAHEDWRVEAIELGGGIVARLGARHDRDCSRVLPAIADGVAELWSEYSGRVRSFAISAPGTVSGTRLVQAANLGWSDLELDVIRPPQATGVPLTACNDATYAAMGELARGAAAGSASSLHLFMDSGIGGALVDGGRVTTGAHGMAGEFGHMPFGSRGSLCRCGARGCWNTELDGAALARALGQAAPIDEVSFSRAVLADAQAGDRPARAAADEAAASLGRGTAGLVNATDVELVVLGGVAADLLRTAPDRLSRAYREGLMQTLADRPPELVAGALGDRGPLVGAMEAAFEPILARPRM
jgi:predicted NBD/HSP70 family sugar kinase